MNCFGAKFRVENVAFSIKHGRFNEVPVNVPAILKEMDVNREILASPLTYWPWGFGQQHVLLVLAHHDIRIKQDNTEMPPLQQTSLTLRITTC